MKREWNHCTECDQIFYSIGDYLCKQCREKLEAELKAAALWGSTDPEAEGYDEAQSKGYPRYNPCNDPYLPTALS